MPFLTTSFQWYWKVQTNAVRQEKEIRGKRIGKGEMALSLCIDDMTIYTENPKELTKKKTLLELRSKVAGHTKANCFSTEQQWRIEIWNYKQPQHLPHCDGAVVFASLLTSSYWYGQHPVSAWQVERPQYVWQKPEINHDCQPHKAQSPRQRSPSPRDRQDVYRLASVSWDGSDAEEQKSMSWVLRWAGSQEDQHSVRDGTPVCKTSWPLSNAELLKHGRALGLKTGGEGGVGGWQKETNQLTLNPLKIPLTKVVTEASLSEECHFYLVVWTT